MWGDKKPVMPAGTPLPKQPTAETIEQGQQKAAATIPSAKAPAFSGEAKTMAPGDAFSNSGSGTARLGSTLHVKGEITGNEDLLIDGSVEGLVQLEDRKLTVGASGNVKGNLRARDRIEIKKDGSVVGDLTTARISIEDGAYFKGSIEIDKTGDEADKSNRSKVTASATS
jgi:cytoskeletal protein CcmA (bactofilin family)